MKIFFTFHYAVVVLCIFVDIVLLSFEYNIEQHKFHSCSESVYDRMANDGNKDRNENGTPQKLEQIVTAFFLSDEYYPLFSAKTKTTENIIFLFWCSLQTECLHILSESLTEKREKDI